MNRAERPSIPSEKSAMTTRAVIGPLRMMGQEITDEQEHNFQRILKDMSHTRAQGVGFMYTHTPEQNLLNVYIFSDLITEVHFDVKHYSQVKEEAVINDLNKVFEDKLTVNVESRHVEPPYTIPVRSTSLQRKGHELFQKRNPATDHYLGVFETPYEQ